MSDQGSTGSVRMTGGGAAPSGYAGTSSGDEPSLGQLVSTATRDLSALVSQEIRLAKAEISRDAVAAGKGAGMLAGAGYAGHMVALFLSIALWWALSHLVGHSWSALIVAVLWGIVGAVAFFMGRKKFREVNPKPERTVETLQQVPSALKPN